MSHGLHRHVRYGHAGVTDELNRMLSTLPDINMTFKLHSGRRNLRHGMQNPNA